MAGTIPYELAAQAYQDEMKSAAIKKRVSISCHSIRMDDDNISIGAVSTRRYRPETIVSVIVPDRATEDGEKKRSFTPSIVEYVKVLSILYALVMTIIGLIFPISEALTDNWLKTSYNTVFMSYQLIVGTAFLVYIQVFALIQKRTKTKKHTEASEAVSAMGFRSASCDELSLANTILGDSNSPDSKNRMVSANRIKNAHTSKSTNHLGDDGHASGTSTSDFLGTPESKLYQRRGSIFTGDFDMSRRPSSFTDFDAQTSYDDDGGSNVVWMDVSKFGSIFNHEGSSLFLKLGALLFSLGNLIYYALEIENSMKEHFQCELTYMLGWTFVLRLIFVLVQTFFIFKGPEVNRTKHLPLLWFGMLHLVSTNICLWFRIVIREIMEETEAMADPESNDTSIIILGNNSDVCESSLLHTASRYLFPFVLEYSLIAVGTIACIIYSISQPTDSEGHLVNGLRNLIKVCSLQQAVQSGDDERRFPRSDEDEHSDEGHDNGILKKSHGGMFLGALLFAGVIVTIVMFYFFQDGETSSDIIYLIADIVIHSCLLIGCLLALWLIRPLAYVAKPMSTDDVFLMVAMCGSAMYEITVVVASAGTIQEEDETAHEEPLRVASSLIAVLQTLIQSMLILCAVRRYPSSEEHMKTMPGRGTFTFLIVGNISVWVLRTALTKSVDMTVMSEYYGEVAWLLLANFNLPLLLFFRFHCSVCFADVWHAAYTPLQSKLKKLRRPVPAAPTPNEEPPPVPEIKKQVPQICIISAPNESQENALDAISLASFNSTAI